MLHLFLVVSLSHLHLIVVGHSIAHLTLLSCRYIQLLSITTSLWSSFDLILDTLSLLFVRISNRQSLTYLHLLRLI